MPHFSEVVDRRVSPAVKGRNREHVVFAKAHEVDDSSCASPFNLRTVGDLHSRPQRFYSGEPHLGMPARCRNERYRLRPLQSLKAGFGERTALLDT